MARCRIAEVPPSWRHRSCRNGGSLGGTVRLPPAQLDHVQQALPDGVGLCLVTAAEGLIDEERGRAVPCGSGQEVWGWTTIAGQAAGWTSASSAATKSGAIGGKISRWRFRQCYISPYRCGYHDRNGAVSVPIADRPRKESRWAPRRSQCMFRTSTSPRSPRVRPISCRSATRTAQPSSRHL
jgi:hypothetical protein